MTAWLEQITELQSLVDRALAAFAAGRFSDAVACADRALAAASEAAEPIDRTHIQGWARIVRARALLHQGDPSRAQAALDELIVVVAATGERTFVLWVRLLELESAIFTDRSPAILQACADALWRELCQIEVDSGSTAEVAGSVLEGCGRLLDVAAVDPAGIETRALKVATHCPTGACVEFERALFERYLHSSTPSRALECVKRLRALAPRSPEPPWIAHICDIMTARVELRLDRRPRACEALLAAWHRLPSFGHARELEVDTGLMLLDVGLDVLDERAWSTIAAAVRRIAGPDVVAEIERLARMRGGEEPWWDARAAPLTTLADLLRWARRDDVPPMWLFEQAEALARSGAAHDPHETSLLSLIRGTSLHALSPEDPEVEPLLERACDSAQFAEVKWAAMVPWVAARRHAGDGGALAMRALLGLHEARALHADPHARRAILRQYRQIVNFALAKHLENLQRGTEGADLGLLDTLELARCHFCDDLLAGSDHLGPRYRPEAVEVYQEALPEGVLILCVLRIDDVALLAAVARGGVIVRATPLTDAQFFEVWSRLRVGLRNFTSWTPKLALRARQVSEALGLDAVLHEAWRRWGFSRHICVVRDERLDDVPFAALVVEGGPLGASAGLSFHPCMRDAVMSIGLQRGRPGAFVALLPEVEADGAAAHRDSPGPDGSARELTALRERGAVVHAGSACTPELLRRATQGAAVLHFGGHNIGRRRDEQIRLGPGAPPLDAASARALQLGSVDLVVLNACDSAQEHLGDQADAWEGLTASFRVAGARTVVSSRMRASADHCALFARTFHSGLVEVAAVDALRRAQRVMAEAASERPDLYVAYWTTYELHGAPFVQVASSSQKSSRSAGV